MDRDLIVKYSRRSEENITDCITSIYSHDRPHRCSQRATCLAVVPDNSNLSWPRGLLHLTKQGELAKVFVNFYTEIYLDIARSHPFHLDPPHIATRLQQLKYSSTSSIVPTVDGLEFKHSVFHRRPSTLFNSSSTAAIHQFLAVNRVGPCIQHGPPNLARSTMIHTSNALLTVIVKGQRLFIEGMTLSE